MVGSLEEINLVFIRFRLRVSGFLNLFRLARGGGEGLSDGEDESPDDGEGRGFPRCGLRPVLGNFDRGQRLVGVVVRH